MKKKICYIFLSLLITFSFINVVNAVDELKFSVSATASSTKVTKGENVTIMVSLKSDSAIAACTFSLSSDDTLELVSKDGANGWNIGSAGSGANGFILENSSTDNVPLSDGKNILKLVYKVNGNGKIAVSTKDCASLMEEGIDENGNPTEISGTYEDVFVNITAIDPADDTNLSSITVTKGGQLITPFDPNTYDSYVIKLSSRNFGLSLTASNPDYQDKIVVTNVDGTVLDSTNIDFFDPSNQGMMIVNVTVNNKTTYQLMAKYDAELDNSLKTLKVDGKNITLESGKYEYKVKVSNSITSVEVEAELADSTNFKFGNNFNGKTIHNFSENSTIYPIVIEPVNTELGAKEQTYTIEIVKEGNPSGNTSSKPSSSSSQGGNTTTNPGTGEISMFFMLIILMASLVGSIYLYQKNIENYK